MDDDEIKRRVCATLNDGKLPRDLRPVGGAGPLRPGIPPGSGIVISGRTLSDLCGACGEGSTHFRYETVAGQRFAFHVCCEEIWREEAGNPPISK